MNPDSSLRNEGCVLWLTGLPCSGKTTLARAVHGVIARSGVRAEVLDGDDIRAEFNNHAFSEGDRARHVLTVGWAARLLARHGVLAIVALVSPNRAIREEVRARCPDFIEVYLSTSLTHCERRDVKGMYQRARRGEISEFTGVSAPYEAPLHPELSLDTETRSVEQCVGDIVELLRARGSVA